MKRKSKFRSLKTKMVLYMTGLVIVICTGLALISYNLSSSALMDAADQSMQKIAEQGAGIVDERIQGYYNQLAALATNDLLKEPGNNKKEINQLLGRLSVEWGYKTVFMANTQGITMDKNIDISEREYFKNAVAGTNTISDPIVSKSDKTMSVFIAVPVLGYSRSVIGVIVANLDGNELSKMISDITFAKTGKAYMINKDDVTIAHSNEEVVLNQEKTFDMLKSDPQLAQLAELEKKMCAGGKGTGQYTYKGVTKDMAYAPVGIAGWSLALAAPKKEVYESINKLSASIAFCSVIFIILSILMAYYISNSIAKPLKMAAASAETLAKGDFSIDIPESFLKRNDEIGNLAVSFKGLTEGLSRLLSNVIGASDQVAAGSRQVSDSSILLSQGATEQASSIEELSASMEEISSQTVSNAENANKAKAFVDKVTSSAEQGNSQMKDMLTAMDDINSASRNISKIIKVIDDIAFQTNILALNAAVEAARAGQYGKGFAVVADEVRNLAARSANAAKETTELIEGSVKKANGGMELAQKTADALNKIASEVSNVSEVINGIAVASNEQAEGIKQINQGIMQISQVVQTNSSTSEESAAASEELSSQAVLLKEQVSKFKLKKAGIKDASIKDTSIKDTGIKDTGIKDMGNEERDTKEPEIKKPKSRKPKVPAGLVSNIKKLHKKVKR
ncbi:MAG: methyl-accepting chemotaxis protein [Bacillota bacterium]|nr:methyl-accepting chemotaxis protein [Bacillota bacterium]